MHRNLLVNAQKDPTLIERHNIVFKWTSPTQGRISFTGYSGPMVSRQYGILSYFRDQVNFLVAHNPRALNKCHSILKDIALTSTQLGALLSEGKSIYDFGAEFTFPVRPIGNSLHMIVPPLRDEEIKAVVEATRPIVGMFLLTSLVAFRESQGSKDSNAIFLMKSAGLQGRNWRNGCVICLEDEMMGTTCSCGHTEIVMFRPCGHSICISPCFQQWMATKDIGLEQETIEREGKTYDIVGCMNTNLDLTEENITCPTCRAKLTSTFRIEDVKLPLTASWNSLRDVILDKAKIDILEEELERLKLSNQ